MKRLIILITLYIQGCDIRRVFMGVKYQGPFPGVEVLHRKYRKQTTELFKTVMDNYDLQDIFDDMLKSRDTRSENDMMKKHKAAHPEEALERDKSKYIPLLHLKLFTNKDSKGKAILKEAEIEGLRSLMAVKRSKPDDRKMFAEQFRKLFLTVERGLPQVCESGATAFGAATPEIKEAIGCNPTAGTAK